MRKRRPPGLRNRGRKNVMKKRRSRSIRRPRMKRSTSRKRVGMRRGRPLRTTNLRSANEYAVSKIPSRGPTRTPLSFLREWGVGYRILRFQNIARQNAVNTTTTPPGSNYLLNFDDGDVRKATVDIYCLTSTNNDIDQTYQVGFSLNFTELTGQVNWQPITGELPSGIRDNSVVRYQTEYCSTYANIDYLSKISIRWIDVRLLLYGARTQPTTYEILVVRFKTDYLAPRVNGHEGDGQHYADYTVFWQNMAKKLMFNSIVPGQRTTDENTAMTVIKRVKVVIQPALTTEEDKNPNSRVIRMFIPDGRMLSYQHAGRPTVDGVAVTDDSWMPVNRDATQPLNTPKSVKARTYLIIRAVNTTNTAATALNTPSYDICLRKKEAFSGLHI